MIFDSPLTPARNKPEFMNACFGCLFNAVLNQRLVNYGQNFFGHRFGRWQKASAVACNGEKAFFDHHIRPLSLDSEPARRFCSPAVSMESAEFIKFYASGERATDIH